MMGTLMNTLLVFNFLRHGSSASTVVTVLGVSRTAAPSRQVAQACLLGEQSVVMPSASVTMGLDR